jgi:hypothetical protein
MDLNIYSVPYVKNMDLSGKLLYNSIVDSIHLLFNIIYYKNLRRIFMSKLTKRLFFISTAILFLAIGLFSQNRISKANSTSQDLLSKIYEQNPSYSNDNVDILSEDFDQDTNKEYFFIFTKKDVDKNDSLNFSADIWFGKENKTVQVVKNQDIVSSTYGIVKLNGASYFRYDLSYATDSQTILLGVKKGVCFEFFRACGAAKFNGSDTFSVLCSSYDMVYDKSDTYSYGHTWKNYYFYASSKGVQEYNAKQISTGEFLSYNKANSILKNLQKKYTKKGFKIKFQFLKRSNGLIHINIFCEQKDTIYQYYQTYIILKDKKLKLLETGEGSYLKTISKK